MSDFNPRRDVQAISHINVVVDDIEVVVSSFRAQSQPALGQQERACLVAGPCLTRQTSRGPWHRR